MKKVKMMATAPISFRPGNTNTRRRFVSGHSIILLAAVALTAGCTFEPGEPWGYLQSQLTVHPVTDSGEVELTDQRVEFGEIELRAPVDTAGGVDDFDPSDPPAGFSLCHQGHCHHEDGDIYTYEEIEAGMGGDPNASVAVTRRELTTETLELTSSAEVEQTLAVSDQIRVDEVAVTVEELAIAGVVESGDETYDLEVSLAMSTRPLSTAVSYQFGPESPETQQMQLSIDWSDELFEQLPGFDAVLEDADDGDVIEIHGTSNPELREALVDRVIDDTDIRWIEQESS